MSAERPLLAVNGTLMRGLELNPPMLAAGAEFVRKDRTVAAYRLYSISDRHPGMVRVAEGEPAGTTGAAANENLWWTVVRNELFMESPINCRNNAQPLVRTDFRPLPPIVAFGCMETGCLTSGRIRSQTCLARTNPLFAPPDSG